MKRLYLFFIFFLVFSLSGKEVGLNLGASIYKDVNDYKGSMIGAYLDIPFLLPKFFSFRPDIRVATLSGDTDKLFLLSTNANLLVGIGFLGLFMHIGPSIGVNLITDGASEGVHGDFGIHAGLEVRWIPLVTIGFWADIRRLGNVKKDFKNYPIEDLNAFITLSYHFH